jgi:hypothetical protein
MAIDRDDLEDARRQLERGESRLDKPRMLMSAQVSSDQMTDLYHHLLERLGQPDPDLSEFFLECPAAGASRGEKRPQRPVPLRQWQEI